MSDKYPASIWRAENPARESHLDPPALYRDQAPLPGTRGWVEYHHTGDCSKAWGSLQALRARDAAELEEAQQIIQQRTEIAVNYQKELKAEREARKGDSAELEKIREDLDHENWRLEKALKVRWNDLVAEREKNARLTAALEKIADFHLYEDGRIGGRAKEIASEALSEAGKDFSGDRPLPSVWIDPDKLARYPEVPAWPAHKHKENEHLIEYVPISRLRSEE